LSKYITNRPHNAVHADVNFYRGHNEINFGW